MESRWQDTTIQSAPVSNQVLDLVHNLLDTLDATACNIPQSSLLPTMNNFTDTNPSFLILLKIQDSTLIINLNVTLHKWCSTCKSIFMDISSSVSSLTSILHVSQYTTLSHYLFL